MIELVAHQPLTWPFRGEPEVDCGHYRRIKVDPFPAYAHDEALVRAELDKVDVFLPPRHRTTFYLLDHEETSRTNGCSWTDRDYSAEKLPDGSAPVVNGTILSAKRIPPHPAMTRYLVWHEYAHHIQDWLQEARGFPLSGHEVLDEYMLLRGYTRPEGHGGYGGGTWHAEPGEVFANDFRAFVAGVETEYWPHPGVPRVEDLTGVPRWSLRGWWTHNLNLLRQQEDVCAMDPEAAA